jgi:hemolysin III
VIEPDTLQLWAESGKSLASLSSDAGTLMLFREVDARSAASSSALPGEIGWNYDRAELIADGIMHAAGVLLGLIGAAALAVIALRRNGDAVGPVLIYVAVLFVMLAISAAYNVWPVSPVKWLLRRFDHSAIYFLIAGTYAPFLAQMTSSLVAPWLSIGLWASAGIGTALKLLLPGRFDGLSIGLYLLLGWSGLLVYPSFAADIPQASVYLLVLGGLLYSLGVVFHSWERLRFHNAIWHGFVLLAAICHYFAVLLGAAVR